MSLSRISIITPSLNRADLLGSAIASVIDQKYHDYEHIVVDGGSTDGTDRTVTRFPEIRYVSGPDRGMYDALNKGLEILSGDIVGFLNSDDLYGERFFEELAREFDDDEVVAVSGRAIVFSDLPDGTIRVLEEYSPQEMSLLESSTVGSNFFNAWFFRRSVFERLGGFNTDFRIAGDRDFMLRLALSGLKYTVLDRLVYRYRSHAGSLTFDKDADKREASAAEHVAMTGKYLSESSMSDLARRLVIRLRTKETVDLAARSLWRSDFRRFFNYFLDGVKYDPVWPLKFLQFSLHRGIARLGAGPMVGGSR